MLDLIASIGLRLVNAFFHVMPIQFNLWVGRSLGGLVYHLSGKRKDITYANLKAAFAGEKTTAELKRITKGVYRHAGETFAEILSMTKFNKAYIEKYVNVHYFDRVLKALENPDGMILVSAHFGNWELSTVTGVKKGIPMYLLARDQKMARLNELLNRLRESAGNIVVRKGLEIKNIFRLLKQGKTIGILADQNAGSSGELLNFFGRPASTANGPYRFAQKSGAWILPVFIHRRKGPYHDCVVEEPMSLGKADDVIPYMQRYNDLLEKHVREFPEQWFWMHKRWKVTPLRKVMVLDDGKKGHLKQSLSIVKRMEEFRKKEQFDPEYLKVDVVKVDFRNDALKGLLLLVSHFITKGFGLHLGLLKLALEEKSYRDVVNRYADIIVSCGSSLFGINRILKLENHAKNVTVLDPGPLLRKKFDLIVVPRHDLDGNMAKLKNVVVTDLAPTLIDPAELSDIKTEARLKTGAKEALFGIGLLVGGENKYFGFSDGLVNSLVNAIKVSCEKTPSYLYATTSRRTPERAESMLEYAFTGSPFLGMFVSGKKDNDAKTVDKILALSDAVIVSGESISMVSESVSSGKPVIVFLPDKKTDRLTKYERFVQGLKEKGFIELVKPDGIPAALGRIKEKKIAGNPPRDGDRITEKLYRLF